MLRLVNLWLISVLMITSAYAGTLRMTYHFSDPEILKNGRYDVITFRDCRLFGETGKASLPVYPVKLLLPPGEMTESVEFIFRNEIILPGEYHIMPIQETRPLSEIGGDRWSEDIHFYMSNDIYPADVDYRISTHFLNGYGIALSAFTPIQYNPAKKEVKYFSEVTVILRTTTDPLGDNRSAMYHPNPVRVKMIEDFVQNPSALKNYSPRDNFRTEEYDYLVITADQYKTEFDTLVHFYRNEGFSVNVTTIEHIDSTSTGQDLPARIRNYIIDAYQESGISFVLLGGDVQIIPHRGFYCRVLSGGSYLTDFGIPADLYYSALDGTWDDNGNGIWGEDTEDDLFPEVAVGRLTFSDTAELHNMLHKVFSYQSNPVNGELNRSLLAGEHLYSSPMTWGSDYLNLLIGLRTDNGYTTLGIPPENPIDSMYDEHGTWSKTDLMTRINLGRPWIHHVGHANYTYNMKLTNSDIINSNFSGANGVSHNFCIVYTHGCMCGGFDQSDCIAERMIGIDNFAVAFIGNSRYGWFNEGNTDGPSEHLHREFLDALYRDSLYHAGMALMKSKAETAPFLDLPGEWEPGATRWCFYDNNLLGDPMMSMWTEEPMAMNIDYIPLVPAGADSIVIQLGIPGYQCSGYTCAVIWNDSIAGSAISDDDGRAVIDMEGYVNIGDAVLTISGYNILTQFLPLHVTDVWLGYGADWNDPSNWLSGSVPDSTTYVTIPSLPVGTKFPLENSSQGRQCKAMLLQTGVNLIVNEGQDLNVTGNE